MYNTRVKAIKMARFIQIILFCHALLATSACADTEQGTQRMKMVDEIKEMAELTADRTNRPRFDPKILEIMGTIPRHQFVPDGVRAYAYENRPLPIGKGQTVSQPYIVALMTDLLEPRPEHVVLEIGTGSGYQAAVLASLVKRVYTMEIVQDLGERARDLLAGQGYDNVEVKIGDGFHGWPEHAPYDGIIVTAVAEEIPPPLLEQLKPEGRMVIPVGHRNHMQHLTLVEKSSKGEISRKEILPVAFVPLTREPEE